MKKHLHSICLIILFCFISPLCFALVSPTVQLQQIANRMIAQLETNKSRLHNLSVIRRIVNQVLIPNVAMERMSSAVIGPYWRTATPAQRLAFEKEFSYLVTTTYSSALASYDKDEVRFQPLRENYAGLQTTRVSSVIVRRNGQRISITYDVLRQGDQWKVYDFSIEHVSMVRSYHSQFEGVLAQGGMPALLARLKSTNQKQR